MGRLVTASRQSGGGRAAAGGGTWRRDELALGTMVARGAGVGVGQMAAQHEQAASVGSGALR